MKPKDGLVKKALEKYPEIDLKDCFIMGYPFQDRYRDVANTDTLYDRLFYEEE